MVGRHPLDSDGHDDELTRRQRAILDCIRESQMRRGYPPSIREIGRAVGLATPSAVSYQLRALHKRGYLDWIPGLARTLRLVPSSPRVGMVSVPLFDQIAAGPPLLADSEPVGVLELPRQKVGAGDLIAVQVSGDSMIEAGIFDGDVAVVRLQDAADHGDIVAARIGEEATVKVLHKADGHTWLLPRSPGYQPIPADDCWVMGKVVATLHPF
jgi:repressor LexA